VIKEPFWQEIAKRATTETKIILVIQPTV
jgi:hypothetical protein